MMQTAWAALCRAKRMAWLNALSVSLALLLLATYIMGVRNLERLATRWSGGGSITCILDDALTADGLIRVHRDIEQLAGVGEAKLISSSQALRRFAARSPEAALLVAGVEPSVLPATVELHLADPRSDLASLQRLGGMALQVLGVVDVDFGDEELEALRGVLAQLHWGGVALGIALGLAIVVLLSNSIRITVYARRQELAILRLVGATPWFVSLPFLMEGAVWGCAGGLFSSVGLYVLHKTVSPRLDAALAPWSANVPVQLFAGHIVVTLLVAGSVLGACGSSLALQRSPEARE